MCKRFGIVAFALVFLSLPATDSPADEGEGNLKQWEASVDKAIAYLRRTQAKDGSWGNEQAKGVTGLVVSGLLGTKRIGPKDPMIAKALKYIESLANDDGHLAGKGANVKLQNYVTSVNLQALTAADPVKYKAIIDSASKFLRKLQWDEGEKKTKSSDYYGGAGYDSKSRPDLSNTQMFLDALAAARVPKNDAAFKKAIIFVSRCQNLKSENNDQPWAGKVNDGSFIYTAAQGGDTKVQDKPGPDGELPGYGSMTYAGIKSLLHCGVAKKDERIQKALGWLRKHYNLESNPGMPKDRSQWGLYYYYDTLARTLAMLGDDQFIDAKGVKHNWRVELTQALVNSQKKGGEWANENGHWMEKNAALATGYALNALADCKPRK
jgi:squalene-hopene/tetraprenyl-beta-curcumene cyclase